MINRILYSPFVKIFLGVLVVVMSGSLVRFVTHPALVALAINPELISVIEGIFTGVLALVAYIYFFKLYDKREIAELSLTGFWKNAAIGLFTGLLLQSLVILVIYFYAGYEVVKINPISYLLPGFVIGLTSAIVEELVVRGIIFRVLEQKVGTWIALAISAVLFGLLHLGNDGATVSSTVSIALQAGILLAAAYIYSRSLWLPIFLHFAWNFAEAGIYGAHISGNAIGKSWLTSNITGPAIISGGEFGPENSIQANIFCFIVALIFLYLAKKRGNFIKPGWK